MMPTPKTEFKPIEDLKNYSDESKWFCHGIVFSPETENSHFHQCPPYIRISSLEDMTADDLFIEVPKIVAYYASVHAGFTMRGRENIAAQAVREFKQKLRSMLSID